MCSPASRKAAHCRTGSQWQCLSRVLSTPYSEPLVPWRCCALPSLLRSAIAATCFQAAGILPAGVVILIAAVAGVIAATAAAAAATLLLLQQHGHRKPRK